MKFKIILISLTIFSAPIKSFCQNYFHNNHNWDSEYVLPENPKADKLTLFENEVVEFVSEDDQFFEFYSHHIVEYIGSETEAEKNFKKYITFNKNSEVVEAKARVIKPNKEEIILDISRILSSSDEETGEYSKYFALEGLESGDIIDYHYVIKKYPTYNGTYKTIQGKYPVYNYSFKLFAPKHLIFDFKLLNDTATIKLDEDFEDKNLWHLSFDSIPPMEEEKLSPYSLLQKKIIYKLDKNIARHKNDISSFGVASQNIYNNIYNNPDKSDLKSLKKFIAGINLSEKDPLMEKILDIENYIKSNIHIVEFNNPDLSKIETILKNKVASSSGITSIFAKILSHFNIEHQIVLTCDRSENLFEKDFESFHFLAQYLIYFPKTKEYLIPDNFAYRYGLVPYDFTNNYGLFISEVKLGDFKSAIGKVKFIPLSEYPKTHLNHTVDAKISSDFTNVELDVTTSHLGHYAAPIQPYIELISNDIVEKMANDMISHYSSNIETIDWSFENTNAKYSSIKPLLLHVKAKGPLLLEVAGNSYIFKVGDLIGPQTELYSETTRILPVYNSYKREFNRKINVKIPTGYKVKNPDDLNFLVDYTEGDKRILLFQSSYTYENDEIVISIKEYYDKIYFETNEYENYRKVVNSASDFNKVTLIIEKMN